jgi:hypothetical protein
MEVAGEHSAISDWEAHAYCMLILASRRNPVLCPLSSTFDCRPSTPIRRPTAGIPSCPARRFSSRLQSPGPIVMAPYLHKAILSVDSSDFELLAREICRLARRDASRYLNGSLFSLLSEAFKNDPDVFSPRALKATGILATEISALEDGVIAEVCRELASQRDKPLEGFRDRTVASLFTECFARSPRRQVAGHSESRTVRHGSKIGRRTVMTSL